MKKVSSNKAKVAAGLGIGLAVATAVVGAYFLHGKKGAKTRRKVKSWMLHARAEVMDQIERAKAFDQKNYKQAIRVVADKYRRLKNIDPREVDLLVKELQGHWQRISRQVAKGGASKARRKKARKARRWKSLMFSNKIHTQSNEFRVCILSTPLLITSSNPSSTRRGISSPYLRRGWVRSLAIAQAHALALLLAVFFGC